VIPAAFSMSVEEPTEENEGDILLVSRISAIILLALYAQLMYFQLKTHTDIFESEEDDDDDEHEHDMSFTGGLAVLFGVTILVSIHAEMLVGSIEGFVEQCGISQTFVGVILLPVVGNAVEHVAAVSVAIKDKMELSMAVAVGSATQVSIFVVPVTVIAGWIMDVPMNLAFPKSQVVVYILRS
jgi:Ca2+:H+ antiporter